MAFPKFICSACGKCCSKISGFVSEDEKKFLEEYGYGKLPLVQLIPVDEMSFPLWDFEAKRFRQYEKESMIDAKIRPSRSFLDLKSGQFVIVTYHMNSEACPFLLKSGKCSIYETRRAFICHLFPFNRSPFLQTGKKDPKEMFGSCPNLNEIIDSLDYDDRNTLVKELYQSFGEAFLAAVQHDYVMEWSNRLIIELMKTGKIRPALNYPYELLKKRFENSKRIDFMDFLIRIGYKKKNEINDIVKKFEDFQDAENRISHLLNEKIFKPW